MIKTEVIGVRMSESERKVIEKASKIDRRSMGSFMVKCAIDRYNEMVAK